MKKAAFGAAYAKLDRECEDLTEVESFELEKEEYRWLQPSTPSIVGAVGANPAPEGRFFQSGDDVVGAGPQ